MFCTSDTIVAIATPPGRGGIGVVRLSGAAAQRVAQQVITYRQALTPRHATLTRARTLTEGQSGRAQTTPVAGDRSHDAAQESRARSEGAIDEVVATFFPGPASYTGEDVVELSAHGSPVVLQAIVASSMRAGARLAEPGEFTLRAFLNGRIDLAQAEAVRDLIDAVTPLQARAAFDQLQGTLTRRICAIDAALFDLIARLEASVDFPDEGYHFVENGVLARALDEVIQSADRLIEAGAHGRLVREGLQIVIVGKPNVGKSSLFNALVGADRAIVTEVAGTTRDLVTEVVDIEGLSVTLVDTAGIRNAGDRIEAEGVERSRRAQGVADLVLVVLDSSQALDEADRGVLLETADYKRLIVKNKIDVALNVSTPDGTAVSASTGAGMPELRRAIVTALDVERAVDSPAITNIRHLKLIQDARQALARARAAASSGQLSEEFVLADLQEARARLEEISGRRTSEDLLTHIFANFCIGK